jgi:hypothetical protein
VTAATGHEEGLDEDSETEGELLDLRCAIKDDGHTIPITIDYWRAQAGGIKCFAKSPYDILAQVSKLTGADVFLDEDNNRLRVTSSLPDQVKEALRKLSNLEKPFVSTFPVLNYRAVHQATAAVAMFVVIAMFSRG